MTLICTEIQQDKPTDGSRISETDVIAQVRIITSIATISFSLKKKKKFKKIWACIYIVISISKICHNDNMVFSAQMSFQTKKLFVKMYHFLPPLCTYPFHKCLITKFKGSLQLCIFCVCKIIYIKSKMLISICCYSPIPLSAQKTSISQARQKMSKGKLLWQSVRGAELQGDISITCAEYKQMYFNKK